MYYKTLTSNNRAIHQDELVTSITYLYRTTTFENGVRILKTLSSNDIFDSYSNAKVAVQKAVRSHVILRKSDKTQRYRAIKVH